MTESASLFPESSEEAQQAYREVSRLYQCLEEEKTAHARSLAQLERARRTVQELRYQLIQRRLI